MWWSKKKEESGISVHEAHLKVLQMQDFTPPAPKYIPKYKVVAKEKKVDCYEYHTIVYMKKGKVKKYLSVIKNDSPYYTSSEDRDLVTGNQYDSYSKNKEGKQIKATLRTCAYGVSISCGNSPYNHNGPFTSFEFQGDTLSVRTDDIDRIVQKAGFVCETKTYEYDELELIK